MPQMDGYTVCARIKTLPRGKQTPVLMHTALADSESTAQAYEAGADDYITKDAGLDKLFEHVKALLETNGAGDSVTIDPSVSSQAIMLRPKCLPLSRP